VTANRLPRFRAILACASLLSGVAGAMAEDKKPPEPMPPWQIQFPFDETFSLRELNGKPVPTGLDVSIKIDAHQHATGFDGCNSFSAVIYPINGQKLVLTAAPALTNKACDKDSKAIENGFFGALLGQPSWNLVNDQLIIKGPKGTMTLIRSL